LISSDFKESLFYSASSLTENHVPGELNLYLRRADGTAVPLTIVGEKLGVEKPGQYRYAVQQARASEDFSHIFFDQSPRQLDENEDPVSFGNTYDWSEGNLKLLGILPAKGATPRPRLRKGPTYPKARCRQARGMGSCPLSGGRTAEPLPAGRRRGNRRGVVPRTLCPRPRTRQQRPDRGHHRRRLDGPVHEFSELTSDANTGETGGVNNDQGADLYSYDVGSKH